MPVSVCRRRVAIASIAFLAVASLGCERRDSVEILAVGHGLDVTHPVHRALERMAALLSESSGGRLRLRIYPSEQLGSERECLELLQLGSLAITKVSAAVLENFAAEYRVFSLPYVFDDDAHRFAVLDGPLGRDILAAGVRRRLRGLAYYDSGSRSFYTVAESVDRPGDLHGLKIRTQESPTAMALVRALGGAATPLAWGELYTALQQGVVDGAENNPPSFHLSRHYEVARHYALDEHTAVPDVVLVGEPVWQRLDRRERRWLVRAARDSAAYQRELWRDATDAALRAVAAAGVRVTRPDKRAFVDATAPVRRAFAADPVLAPLLRRIEEARQ